MCFIHLFIYPHNTLAILIESSSIFLKSILEIQGGLNTSLIASGEIQTSFKDAAAFSRLLPLTFHGVWTISVGLLLSACFLA